MPHRAEATGSLTAGHQLPTPGPGSDPTTTLPEGIDGVPIVVNGQVIGWNIGGEFFTQAEVDSLIATGSFPEDPTTDTGGSAPSFASTSAGLQQAFQNDQALLGQQHENDLAILQQQLESASGINAQNIQAQIDLENLKHENDLAELALQFENQLKTSVIGEIGAERRTRIQEQGATKRQLLELGPDPFKQSAILSGQAVRGITPQQVAVGQAQQFINQPLPNIDFNATLPQLQAQLGTIQGTQAPTLTGGFGLPSLAHGGVIEMEKNGGAFQPTGKQTFLVGDGAGIIPGITEALTIGDGKVEVTPFAGGAQGGLSLQLQSALDTFQQQGLQQSSLQALQPLFGSSSPTFASPSGTGGEISVTNFGALSGLGVTPQYVREIETGKIYGIENGQRRYITSPEALAALGVQPGSIINAYAAEIASIAPTEGAPVVFGQTPSSFTQGGFPGPITGTPAFQGLGTPLVEPTTGAILPAPFKRASQLGQFSRDRPDLFNNALSAFRAAGLDPSSVIAQIEAATPTGRFSRPQRIGFTGARL